MDYQALAREAEQAQLPHEEDIAPVTKPITKPVTKPTTRSRRYTSSPMRFERECGLFIVTCMNIKDAATGEHVSSMHQAESRYSFKDAKRIFWMTWADEMDGWLTPRYDGQLADIADARRNTI